MYSDSFTKRLKYQSFIYSTLTLITFAIYGCANRQALNHSSNSVKTDFKNEGEREDYETVQFFTRKYKVEYYKRYKNPIVLDSDYYRYKDAIIDVPSSPEARAILDKEIFYPDVMARAFKYQPKMKITINKDSLLAWRKRDTSKLRNVIRKIDTIRIANFEEIKFVQNPPKQKRFRFWLFRKGFANPTVYFMELTNKKATAETDLLSFINGARLTFFQQGWVII